MKDFEMVRVNSVFVGRNHSGGQRQFITMIPDHANGQFSPVNSGPTPILSL